MIELSDLQVEFQPLGNRVTIPVGSTILDAVRQAGIDLTSACGGEGNCGQCRIILLAGAASNPDGDETFYLNPEELQKGYRLACRTRLQSDVKVHLPKDSLITGQRLQVESNLRSLPPDPLVRAYPVILEPPTLQDIRSDLTRLVDELQNQHGLGGLSAGTGLIRALSPGLRSAGWHASVYIRDGEIIAVQSLDSSPLGLAVDLGTTKIAAMLVDLETSQTLASAATPNPQIGYGEDVISRLNYAYRHPDGSRLLAETVRQSLNDLLADLLGQVGGQPGQVAEACIVGNTAMTHLLLGFPTQQLAMAPYVAAASQSLNLHPGELGLGMAPGATVHIPPSIGGFVGADHVAMVLASDLDQSTLVTLGLDIGTNTEISLHLPGQSSLTAVSCASGPAFEGAHIQDGMRAASGAIEKVHMTPAGWNWTTIDDEPPVGLCGSGILDALAELYRGDILTQNGRLRRDQPGVREGDYGVEFLLVPAMQSGSKRDIVITQHDVNEIQLAKGAIQTGLNILLESAGIPPEAVQEVIVAGAFGSFLNIQNAIDIGLFPHLPNAHYRQVGNAAALGAKWILISREARRRAEQIARNTRYLELTTYPKFNRQFALAMLFPEKKRWIEWRVRMKIIGEKINGTRKRVAQAIAERDAAYIADLAQKQTTAGATWLDVNAGTHPSQEADDLIWLIETIQEVVDTPLSLDSANPTALRTAIHAVKHVPMINSISGEPERLAGILPIVAEHGCPVIALAMDEKKIPETAEKRFGVIQKLVAETRRHGVSDSSLYIDPLAMTVSTNAQSAMIAFETMQRVRQEIPQAHLTIGLSNISFGLPARSIVNRYFLSLALMAGLDSAILDPLDRDIQAAILTSELLLGQDPHCLNFIRASRKGLFEKPAD